MTPLPILGVLLEVAEMATHWPVFRWAGWALGLVAQVLALYYWSRARTAPPAVLYACPRCGFLGDREAVEAHRCR